MILALLLAVVLLLGGGGAWAFTAGPLGSVTVPTVAGKKQGSAVQAVHRAPGSIGGCATPGRVFKGVRMAGRMGSDNVTTQNLSVFKVDAEAGVLLIKGAIPGRNGGLVVVRTAIKRGEK